MTTWYLLESGDGGDETSGPYDIEQMAMRASSGRLSAGSLVARVGSSEWIPAEDDPDLVGFFRSTPPTESFSPSSRPTPEVSVPAVAGEGYSFGNAFNLATATFRSRWGHLVVTGLVFLAITVAIAAPQGMLEAIGDLSGDERSSVLFALFGGCVGFVLQVLVGLPLSAGLVCAAANAVRGRTEVGDLFMGFRRYGTVLLASLVLMAIGVAVTALAYLAAAIVATIFGVAGGLAGGLAGGAKTAEASAIGAIVLGLLVAFAIGVLGSALVLVRVMFVPAMVADPTLGRLTVGDALRWNWHATRGRGFSMVLLMICGGVLAALSVLLLCVGYVLVGLPLLIAVFGATYELVVRGHATPPTTANREIDHA